MWQIVANLDTMDKAGSIFAARRNDLFVTYDDKAKATKQRRKSFTAKGRGASNMISILYSSVAMKVQQKDERVWAGIKT